MHQEILNTNKVKNDAKASATINKKEQKYIENLLDHKLIQLNTSSIGFMCTYTTNAQSWQLIQLRLSLNVKLT